MATSLRVNCVLIVFVCSLVSEALSICIVKLVSPCNAMVAFALSESAVRGLIPAHHGNLIFFFLFDRVYKIIKYLI